LPKTEIKILSLVPVKIYFLGELEQAFKQGNMALAMLLKTV
jgi:hypothetical protein